MATQVDTDKLIDWGGKALASAAGFMAADKMLFGGTVTPDAVQPFVGLLVCIGVAVVVWRLVKP